MLFEGQRFCGSVVLTLQASSALNASADPGSDHNTSAQRPRMPQGQQRYQLQPL